MNPYHPTAFRDAGVYKIQIGPTFYIGSCSQFGKRISGHKSELAAGTHPNKKLQAAWDQHQSLEAFILRSVPRKAYSVESDQDHTARLRFNEQEFIDAEFDHLECANTSRNSRFNSTISEHMRQKWNDPEWRKNASAKIRAAAQSRQVTDETRRKMSIAKKGDKNPNSRPCVIHHNGKSTRFQCASDAAKHFNATQQAMDAWLKGTTPWPGTGPRPPRRKDLIGITGKLLD
jgi:hypothetical protein